jgi:type IV secretion system protein VirD4
LLLLLDEAANIAPFPGLDAVASTGASQGLQLLPIFQDMAQLETLGYISRVSGAAEFEQRSRNTGERGRRSWTEGETYRDLAPANVVRERESATALLLYHNLPLAKIDLRLWFEDQELMDLQRQPTLRAEIQREYQ